MPTTGLCSVLSTHGISGANAAIKKSGGGTRIPSASELSLPTATAVMLSVLNERDSPGAIPPGSYDPINFFRFNQSIEPALAGPARFAKT